MTDKKNQNAVGNRTKATTMYKNKLFWTVKKHVYFNIIIITGSRQH